jgi:hypothetical protein
VYIDGPTASGAELRPAEEAVVVVVVVVVVDMRFSGR